MNKQQTAHSKGYLLFVVLSTIIIVSLFASILMTIILSQGRLTKHQTSRIQAYYASMGALYYTYDKLRQRDPQWTPVATAITANFCKIAAGCPGPPNVIDPDLPATIRSLQVVIEPPVAPNTSNRIRIIADYTLL
jgi:Tfp pilus assembly protein PilX